MKNLENYEVLEMSQNQITKTSGGGIIILATVAFFMGRRVEYVKDGGGWFDYYL